MAVGRFQVMAMLQAARAFELGLPRETALSWGLNRAIFYAAAKRGFKGGPRAPGATRESGPKIPKEVTQPYSVGDDVGFTEERDGKKYFAIGGKLQTEEDFERQIESRFGPAFPNAWEDALDYVRQFERDVLISGNEFFSAVYRPKRDEFAAKWTDLSQGRGDSPKKGGGPTKKR